MDGEEGSCPALRLRGASEFDQCLHSDCLAFLGKHALGKIARVFVGERERAVRMISDRLASGPQQREFVGACMICWFLWSPRDNRRAVNRSIAVPAA